MAQEPHRRSHVPGLNLTADVGAGHPDALQGLLRHHPAGQSPAAAVFQEQPRGALAPVSEPEIRPADKARRLVFLLQHPQKVLPGHGPHGRVKGQAHHLIHLKPLRQQQLPIPVGINQRRGSPQHQGVRMIPEGHHTGPGSGSLRQLPAGPQQGGMAQMYPVKKAQGANPLSHSSPFGSFRKLPENRPSLQRVLSSTSKKLFIVDITPFSTLASIRKPPSGP